MRTRHAELATALLLSLGFAWICLAPDLALFRLHFRYWTEITIVCLGRILILGTVLLVPGGIPVALAVLTDALLTALGRPSSRWTVGFGGRFGAAFEISLEACGGALIGWTLGLFADAGLALLLPAPVRFFHILGPLLGAPAAVFLVATLRKAHATDVSRAERERCSRG